MNTRATASPMTTIGAAAVAAAALLLLAAAPAAAAKPPAGRTYYAVFVGLDENYELDQECFVFTDHAVCDLDGEICGAWWHTEAKAGEMGIAYELSFSDDDGELTRIYGHARLDALGRASSLGGAGHLEADGVKSNFSFAARQTPPNRCAEIIDPTEPPPPPTPPGFVTQTRQVADFHEVSLTGVGELYIEHTGSESLTITAREHLMPLITTEVRDGRLILGKRSSRGTIHTGDIVFRLTVRTLDAINVSGIGLVDVRDIDTPRLRVDMSGIGTIIAAGRADRQDVRISGIASYEAGELVSRIATIDVSGMGRALLRVSEELSGRVSGFGVVEYLGSPAVNVTVTSFAVLRRAGD